MEFFYRGINILLVKCVICVSFGENFFYLFLGFNLWGKVFFFWRGGYFLFICKEIKYRWFIFKISGGYWLYGEVFM